jgi:hypothetical protein
VGALDVKIDGSQRRLRCGSSAEKEASYQKLYGWLRSIDENDARAFVRELCASVDVDLAGLGTDLMLSWDQIRQLGADARVTIGSHTRRHYALAKLTLAEARAEIEEGAAAPGARDRPRMPAFRLPVWRRGQCRAARIRPRP